MIANLAHPRFYDFSDKTEVLIQDNGTFTNIQGGFEQPLGETGIRFRETHSVPALADFNLDGNLDLVISATYDGRPTDVYLAKAMAFQLHMEMKSPTVGACSCRLQPRRQARRRLVTQLFRNRLPTRRAGISSQSSAMKRPTGPVLVRSCLPRSTVAPDYQVSGGSGQGCQDSLTVHFDAREPEYRHPHPRFPGGKNELQSDALQKSHTWGRSGLTALGTTPPQTTP